MKVLFVITLIFHVCYLACGEVDLQNVDIPDVDIDDFTVIKEKCDKAGGPGTYDKLKASKDSLQTCITQFANATVVKNEIEEAKKTGSMDEVFGKYCRKREKLASCLQTFTDNLRACLNSEESKALNTTLDVLKQLGEFVCFRDGDRLAMFIAEHGIECIQSRTEGIKDCINSTFKIEPDTVNTNSLPNLLLDKKKCDDLGRLQTCVVDELEKCEQSTPANIIDAVFKFIKRSACGNKNKRNVFMHNVMKRSPILTENFYNATEFKSNLLSVLKDKCAQNAPDGGYEALILSLESATHCIKNKTKEDRFLIAPADKFKENINQCVSKLQQKMEACLTDEEKYWPKFYIQIFQNLIDFMYTNKNIWSNISRVELINCFQNFKQSSEKREMYKCIQIPESNDLKKEVICKRMSNMKECISGHIRKKCISDVTINQLTESFFKALTDPCNQNGN